jgi:hypothetical protein
LLKVYVCVDAPWSNEGAFAIQKAGVSGVRAFQVTTNANDDTVFDTYVLSYYAIRWSNLVNGA